MQNQNKKKMPVKCKTSTTVLVDMNACQTLYIILYIQAKQQFMR